MPKPAPTPSPTHLALIAAPLGSPKLPAPVTVYAAGWVRILCGGCMEPMGRGHGNACGATGGGVD